MRKQVARKERQDTDKGQYWDTEGWAMHEERREC